MFVFQSKPMTVRDSQLVRSQLWGELDKAQKANDRSWFLDAAGRLSAEYSKLTDPSVVREIKRLVDYTYVVGADGRYRQVVQDPSTVIGVISAVMAATTNCPEVRGELFGDSSRSPPVPGLFGEIRNNLVNADDGVQWSQQQLLSTSIDLVSVDALKVATTTAQNTPQTMLSLSILLSSLKTGGDLYQLDEKYNSFTQYVQSLEALLRNKDLRLVATAAGILGHLDYNSQGASLMPEVKRSLENAFDRPDLDVGTRKTIQWALSGPTGLSSIPSERGFEINQLNADNFQDAIYGFINASGQYQLLSQMSKTPVFQTVPVQLTTANAVECSKFLDGLKTYFECLDLTAPPLTIADQARERTKRWEAARQPIDGLVKDANGKSEPISQADFAIMTLNAIAEAFKDNPDPAIRDLVAGKIYPLIEGRLGSLASRVRVGFGPLSGPSQKKGTKKTGVPTRPVWVTGAFDAGGDIVSGSLHIDVPDLYFIPTTSEGKTQVIPVYDMAQNLTSSSPLPPDQTQTLFQSSVAGIIKYAETGIPDVNTATDIMNLLQNANPSDFIGGTAGYQKALAAAQAGDIATMLTYFDPDKNPYMRDTELRKSGLLTSTKLSLFTTVDVFSVGWYNPTAFEDLYNFISLADTRYKWCVLPLSADVSTYKLFGGLLENRLFFDPTTKAFTQKPDVPWTDTGKRYSEQMDFALVMPRATLGHWLSMWGVRLGLSGGDNLLTKKFEFQEGSIGLHRIGQTYSSAQTSSTNKSYSSVGFHEEAIQPYASATFRPHGPQTYTVGADVLFPRIPIWSSIFEVSKFGAELTGTRGVLPEKKLNCIFATREVWDWLNFQLKVSPDWEGMLKRTPLINEFQASMGIRTKELTGVNLGEFKIRYAYKRPAAGVMEDAQTLHQFAPSFNFKPYAVQLFWDLPLAIQRNAGIGIK